MSDYVLELPPTSAAYPERLPSPPGTLETLFGGLRRFRASRRATRRNAWAQFLREVDAHAPSGGAATEDLAVAARALRPALRREGLRGPASACAFALVREAAGRTLGCRHFETQLIGGRVLLDGMIAEMETGEGKTLTATLPACTAALAGLPVHIITANDYLARRDAEWMAPVYRTLGLRVGVVTHGMDHEARRAAYACDVTYASNKEIAFDYLRDRLARGRQESPLHLRLERLYGAHARMRPLVMRGLVFAIVDEADSVLVDEARTPLIISQQAGRALEQREYGQALAFASRLEPGRDFLLPEQQRTVVLTDAGKGRLRDLAQPLGGLWAGAQFREHLVTQALVAQRLLIRDKHYLVKDGRVQIIDEYTGRLSPDRSWERGLHQLLETKEGCELAPRQETIARISYQRFFRRYLRLAGMTGTAREVARELLAVYGLRVVSIPTHRPNRRRRYRDRLYPTAAAKWQAVLGRVMQIHRTGRPILIGTRSVEASEHLSRLLHGVGLPHQLLNARQDREEAEIISRAGELGAITVATNMAGRGTDIHVPPEAAELGGLHVIATERHDARRIDRQLFGRCARQGDPGSHEVIASLEDELVQAQAPWLGAVLGRLTPGGRALPGWLSAAVLRFAQRRAERAHARLRRALLATDEQLGRMLAFTGRLE